MFDFLNLYPDAFGLDISDRALKIIKLKKKSAGLALEKFGEISIKQGIIKNGEIKKQNDLINELKRITKTAKLSKKETLYANVSLPEKKAFLKIIKMPKIKEQEMKEAIVFEAENYIPLPIENVYLDFQIIDSNLSDKNSVEVLLVAIPKTIVNSYIDCLKKAGITALSLEVESSAIARALIKNNKCEKPVFLIDLGLTRTGFIISLKNSLRFTCSTSISSQMFSQAIAKFLNVDFKEAEKLKIKYGISDAKRITLKADKTKKIFQKKIISDKKIHNALLSIISDLAKQIQKYLDFYNSKFEKNKIDKILISGGGAELKGLKEFLNNKLNISVEKGDPWINIKEHSLMPAEKSLKYTTAIGLALRN